MARSGLVTPLLLAACIGAVVYQQCGFIGAAQQKSGAALRAQKVGRHAAAPGPAPPASDFSLSFDVVPEDGENKGRASAVFFFILGFAWVPVLKGLTCALVLAALAYFAGNGSLTSFLGKTEGAKEYGETAKTVEGLSAGVGGYLVKGYNFAAEKVKSSS
eukprot:TRINITY_DN21148_c0_g1_i1.p1 TRINITY_DN21148_c0_g1~~TRINITY_DN21148_c0_g1_i1.p1  ORF type:complete len:160 (-),score=59.95 TRINITY_DN21148_c0_g1_i1:282-761(-)